MLAAMTEAEARAKLSTVPHGCGDTTFTAPMLRSHDERGLWLVFRGPCPRCQELREERFFARPPAARAPPLPVTGNAPVATARVLGEREEDELYGQREVVCQSCDGTGEWHRVGGDYAATEAVQCTACRGSGRTSKVRGEA
ncbi:MAG: hypothetical protein MUC96_18945 [Myxococcaceae bacterium]|jgi:hypothetical protein|nr:hypothetical protein [Myxococcaceae bacterium]